MLRLRIIFLALAISKALGQYQLAESYDYKNWLTAWYFDGDSAGQASGFANYQNFSSAQSLGLVQIIGNQIYMGVDNTTVVSSGATGRNSLSLESYKKYTHYLLILDAEHMPEGVCGIWPSFWSINEASDLGEVDIVEYGNLQTSNDMTLHTNNTCEFSPRHQTGEIINNVCDKNKNVGGCATTGGLSGSEFNIVGGGVYATVWTGSAIQIFFWQRSDIPGDVSSGNPNPSTWGTPLAGFEQTNGGCNIDQNFEAQSIQIDTAFCGGNAGGSVWTNDPVCSKLASSCEEYVAANPAAYDEAYWLFNSVKVYLDASDPSASVVN